MTMCLKCQISILRNEDSVQCDTCITLTHMKCSKMDKDSLEYHKTIGKKYNCDECTNKVKIGRHDDTPIKDSTHKTKEIDTKSIIDRLDQVLRNQVTTNNSQEELNNRVIELEKSLIEKYKVILSLEYKINTSTQILLC